MSTCWYCEKNVANAGSSKKVILYKKGGVTATRRLITQHYQTIDVTITGCLLCKESYDRINRFTAVALTLSSLAGVLAAILIDLLNPGYFGLAEICIGIMVLALGIYLSRLLIKKIPVHFLKGKDPMKYPEIAEKLADGWKDYKS
ncbi:MAG: hypothetical protein NTZ12_09275 [Candidatus Aminicenantes bacterium]|nr:hypothetical protein [Candidatus Aminicenantes bacterium]